METQKIINLLNDLSNKSSNSLQKMICSRQSNSKKLIHSIKFETESIR